FMIVSHIFFWCEKTITSNNGIIRHYRAYILKKRFVIPLDIDIIYTILKGKCYPSEIDTRIRPL
ncbi:MAG: hypothetical protein WCF01_01565, partial [Nitrososphaeraceae archaeon]